MATYSWEFGAAGSGSYAVVYYDTEAMTLTVNNLEGSFDLNAIWFSDGDNRVGEGGAILSKTQKSLDMNSTNVKWDDVAILSSTGLGSEGTQKSTFFSEGETQTYTLAQLQVAGLDPAWITDWSKITLGLRETTVNGKGSAKHVDTTAQATITSADIDHQMYGLANFLQGDIADLVEGEFGYKDTLAIQSGTYTMGSQSILLLSDQDYNKGYGDTVYAAASNGATINFGSDTVAGGGGIDEMYGDIDSDANTSAVDTFPGGGTYNFGADKLYGNGGDDAIFGDARQLGNFPPLPEPGAPYQGTYNLGSDYLNGGDGGDYLLGDIDEGDSGLFNFGGDTMLGGSGYDIAIGDATYLLALADPITAVSGNDYMSGGDGGDQMCGDVVYVQADSGSITIAFGDDTLAGGAGDDYIIGDFFSIGGDVTVTRDGNDVLNGGLGNDLLVGNAGSDKFVFSTALDSALNVDTIEDFSSSEGDQIVLDDAIFTQLSNATLLTDLGTKLLYDNGTGVLAYDADGAGAYAPVEFAVLANVPATLSASDFLVV